MAKKKASAPNKSQAIRDYYAAHPKAKPQEVASELKKKGIAVSAGFVSTIRSTSKKKKTVGKPGRPPGSKAATGARQSAGRRAAQDGQEVSIDTLLKVKKMVEEMGGIGETRTALSALEKLMG